MLPLTLQILDERLGIAQLSPDAPFPPWLPADGFVSATRTAGELSIVCTEAAIPSGVRCERGWRGLQVEGPLDFALTGILARLTAPLANAELSIFALSTYDTDYLLVRADALNDAVRVLKASGHRVVQRLA